VPELAQWFPNFSLSESEHSARSNAEEVADHPDEADAFEGVPLLEHYGRNRMNLRTLLEQEETKREAAHARELVVYGCQARQRQCREQSGRASSSRQDMAPSAVAEEERILITSLTASGVRSLTLHPRAYRNLPNVSSISDLEKALNVQDLRGKMRALQKHHGWPVTECALVDFCDLSVTADESVVNSEFSALMKNLSFMLGFKCFPDSQR
jgi:hypothetical protein